MKKIIVLFLAIVCALGLFACNKNESLAEISYGTKYYFNGDLTESEEERSYYLFKRDGTAEYCSGTGTSTIYNYDVAKNGAVVLILIKTNANGEIDSLKRGYLASISEKTLINSTGGVYVNEKFVEEILDSAE